MYSGDAPHQFVDVHLAVVDVPAEGELVEQFLEILHGVGAVVGGEGTGLANGVDVAHVADGGRDMLVLVLDEVIDLFIGGVALGHERVLEEVGVVGAGCIGEVVPKPLKGWAVLRSRPCRLRVTWRVTVFIIITMAYQLRRNQK